MEWRDSLKVLHLFDGHRGASSAFASHDTLKCQVKVSICSIDSPQVQPKHCNYANTKVVLPLDLANAA